MSSLHWATIGRFSSQLVTWSITILVIRILTPEDYGLMALASMIMSFFAAFEGLGLTAAIIQTQDLRETLIRKVFAAIIMFAAILYGIIFLIAPYAANFFGAEGLSEIIRVLCITVPIAAFGALPLALIQRGMMFKQKSIVEFVAAVASSVITLVLAVLGYSVWSLVIGSIALFSIQSIGYWLVVGKFYWPDFDARQIKNEVRFGSFVMLDRFIWLFYSQADVFFIGKFLGTELLGIYSVALQLATLPMKKVVGILNEVGFSAFSKVQSSPSEIAYLLKKAVSNLGLIAFPVFIGISSIAPLIVNLFLDEQWAQVAVPLTLLALIVPFRLLNTTTPTLLYGLGRADIAAQNGLLALLILSPAFAIAAMKGGLVEVCLVWLIVYPLYYAVCLLRVLPMLHVGLGEYLREILAAGFSAAAMFVAVRGMSSILDTVVPSEILQLILLILLGAVVFTTLMLLIARHRLVELRRLIMN